MRPVAGVAPVGCSLGCGAPTWTPADLRRHGVAPRRQRRQRARRLGERLGRHGAADGRRRRDVDQAQPSTTDRVDFRDIDAIDERTAYVLSIGNGATSRIYKTTDAGATWTLQFANEDPKVFLDAMTFWDATHGIAMSDSIDGQLRASSRRDDGKTWTRMPDDRAAAGADPTRAASRRSGTNIAVLGTTTSGSARARRPKARVLRSSDRGTDAGRSPTRRSRRRDVGDLLDRVSRRAARRRRRRRLRQGGGGARQLRA